jgi:hypothetical protein
MMVNLRLWNTGPGGAITTEEDNFRLTVQPSRKDGGAVWFFVLRRMGNDFSIAAGGTETDIYAAMAAVTFMGSLLSHAPCSVPLTGDVLKLVQRRTLSVLQDPSDVLSLSRSRSRSSGIGSLTISS